MQTKLIARLSKPGIGIADLLSDDVNAADGITNWGGIEGSRLYLGTSHVGDPKWLGFISAGTTAALPKLQNEGAWGLLFVPIDSRYMILSYGYSSHQLSGMGLETDFGLKVVLNTVDPIKIKSIDSKTHDTVVTNKRIQLSQDRGIEDFGFEINKDFLKQLTGKPSNKTFASIITGGESVTLNCELHVGTVASKVKEIYKYYKSKAYKVHYDWIDNVVPVKDTVVIADLNKMLLHEINNAVAGGSQTFDVACPEIIDYTTIDHFRVRGYRSTNGYSYLDAETLIEDLNLNGVTSLTDDNLASYKIDAVNSSDEVVGTWHLYKWLIFEAVLTKKHYVFSDGEWFEIGKKYFNNVEKLYNGIISSKEYSHIGSTTAKNETDYLGSYPASINEAILDRQLVYVYGRGNAIEICDIYTLSQEFVHVKDGGSSSKLSHLFNQGYVSASAFINDVKFQKEIKNKLKGIPTLAKTIVSNPKSGDFSVIYRILKSGKKFSIPFFSKIVLIDMKNKITTMGFQFKLEWVQKK